MIQPKPKKKTRGKYTIVKTQEIFNMAIRERDGYCITCYGQDNLQCSHFYSVGGNGGIRFYPLNAWAQCAGCHIGYHNRNPMPYVDFMQAKPGLIDLLESMRGHSVRYSQEALKEIVGFCQKKDFDGLAQYIELLHGLEG